MAAMIFDRRRQRKRKSKIKRSIEIPTTQPTIFETNLESEDVELDNELPAVAVKVVLENGLFDADVPLDIEVPGADLDADGVLLLVAAARDVEPADELLDVGVDKTVLGVDICGELLDDGSVAELCDAKSTTILSSSKSISLSSPLFDIVILCVPKGNAPE